MKLRTFMVTLLLFLIFFYGAILFFLTASFKSSLASIKERALGEHYFISSSYYSDLMSIKNREDNLEEPGAIAESLFDSYAFYYQKQPVFLAVYQNGMPLKSTLPQEENFYQAVEKKGDRIVFYRTVDQNEYMVVIGALPNPFEEFEIIYCFNLTDTMEQWDSMTKMLMGIATILSVLLGIILYLILTHIFQPLIQIADISEKIANGEYENKILISGSGELHQVAESFNHMTDEIKKHIEQLSEEAKRKQQFIDNMAHELRTPLTSIYGYAEYIQKARLTEIDKYEATEFIMSESRRLQEVSERLLKLALFREGKMEWEELDILDILKTVEKVLKPKIMMKNISFKMNVSNTKILGDRTLLECLFSNVIENAIKACSDNGKISIEVNEENDKSVLVAVKDNGKGIPEYAMKHLMEAFYRVDKARDRAAGGAGIGLALCKQIMDRHQGEIYFESIENVGTTVCCIFTVL